MDPSNVKLQNVQHEKRVWLGDDAKRIRAWGYLESNTKAIIGYGPVPNCLAAYVTKGSL